MTWRQCLQSITHKKDRQKLWHSLQAHIYSYSGTESSSCKISCLFSETTEQITMKFCVSRAERNIVRFDSFRSNKTSNHSSRLIKKYLIRLNIIWNNYISDCNKIYRLYMRSVIAQRTFITLEWKYSWLSVQCTALRKWKFEFRAMSITRYVTRTQFYFKCNLYPAWSVQMEVRLLLRWIFRSLWCNL
jgi:hypothetical protein